VTQDETSKDLIIIALKQRIGEMSSAYEYQIATIRAEYTKLEVVYRQLLSTTPQPQPPTEEKIFPSVDDLLGDA
jgi:hypothetical protein